MKTGVQGLGWYVLRAKDPVPLIRFYRDALGLGQLRGREEPAHEASAMLWAGGTTVFEPNRGGSGEHYDSLEVCPFVPVFRSNALDQTLKRLHKIAGVSTKHAIHADGDTLYFRDPLGFIFGVEPADETSLGRMDPENNQPLSVPDVEHALESDILDLGRLEFRTENADTVRAFYQSAFGLNGYQDNSTDLDMGDGAVLRILSGGTPASDQAAQSVSDRESETMVPVFRLYGYNSFVARMNEAGARQLQEVELTGGRLWYGWDPADRLFGFQERRPPNEDSDKWTTRLPEDLMARRIWTAA